LDRLDLDTEKPSDEEMARKFGFEEAFFQGRLTWWQRFKPQLWSMFDEPYSSNAAKVRNFNYFTTQLLFIVYNLSNRDDSSQVGF
jgi:hypothetical protein